MGNKYIFDTTGLIEYWSMDELYGARVGLNQDITLDNTTANAHVQEVGKINKSTKFVTHRIFSEDEKLDLVNSDFNLACWFYVTAKDINMDIVSQWATGAEGFILGYIQTSDRLRFVVENAARNASYTVLADGLGSPSVDTWYFLTAWYDSVLQTINIQVNNGTINSVAAAAGVYTSSAQFCVGSRQDEGSVLAGMVDELSYWHKVLSTKEKTYLYNSGNGRSLYSQEVITANSLYNGIWSWFTNQRAVINGSSYYFGFVDETGSVYVGDDNIKTLLKTDVDVDDHANPSIIALENGKILVFYSGHNDSTIYKSESTGNNITAFNSPVSLVSETGGANISYPCPIQLTGEENDPIYLFYRADGVSGGRSVHMSKSINNGLTWLEGIEIFENSTQRPYHQITRNGTDRIDFAVTSGHPGEVATNSLYHFYYTGGNYYKSDGTLIGDSSVLPIDPTDVTLVYDGTTNRCWVWDIFIDGDGNPIIAYTNFVSTTDHRYRYAKFNGTTWDDAEIVAGGTNLYAGQPYYSGGVAIDRSNINAVYVSINTAGNKNIFKYVTADGGATWAVDSQISTSNRDIRPYSVGERVYWVRGTYTTFEDYLTRIESSPQY